ncbi:ABC transporter permease [Desulfobulbus alkaliphilus]|uniref:ABC transporter permease n=1 Tax=Desulfobulbus alkaliphilus TaxID=869814 RepID=UPI001F06536F|nr:FtsX-like permease family protein [Desulfobulbus alkaliphilus]
MPVLVRLGWRDLSRNRRFTLLFILNLALGLTGFLVITSFGSSLGRHLDDNIREMLTADLVLRSARPLTVEEMERSRLLAGPGSRFSEQVSLYTMVTGNGVSRLAEIVAIDGSYPLYGAFEYSGTLSHIEVITGLQQDRKVLVHRETARSLGLNLGDTLAIGQAEYEIAYFFDRDPGSDFTALTLGPTIYLGMPHLQETGLISFGSRLRYYLYIGLPATADLPGTTARITEALAGPMVEPPADIQVVDARDINRNLNRVMDYFSGYLGLAGLVALFLAGMAAAYLFSEHLRAKRKETAVLLSLGASHRQCLVLYTGQLALLGLTASLVALVLAHLLLPIFAQLFAGIVPADLQLRVHARDAGIIVLVGSVGSLLFCLPVYQRLFNARPLHLLQETGGGRMSGRHETVFFLFSLLPPLTMLLLLAIVASDSLLQGTLFTGGLVITALFFFLAATLVLGSSRRWSHTSNLTWKIVWRNLHRNRLFATPGFVAIALAMLLVSLVPQIENGLLTEIRQPEDIEMPVFFLIDIQDAQRQPLEDFFRGTGHELSPLSSMIQGRIVTVNGIPFRQWLERHERAEDNLFRRTEFNFSSRDKLDVSETIVQGPPLNTTLWSPQSGAPFEISMEEQFSERLGVVLGDHLMLSIHGIEMEGRIVNLRAVRWNSFQPNFFMLLQNGVLDEAPRTYLASVSRVEADRQQEVMNQLTAAFPNISVIDVSRTVEQLGAITVKLAASLRFMAVLAMVTGLVAVFAIARQEALRREREINLLRVLGAGPGKIRLITMLEFGFMGGAATMVAIAVSYACSHGVAWLLFDRIWQFDWQTGVGMLVAAMVVCSLTALLASDSVIRRRPSELLG